MAISIALNQGSSQDAIKEAFWFDLKQIRKNEPIPKNIAEKYDPSPLLPTQKT